MTNIQTMSAATIIVTLLAAVGVLVLTSLMLYYIAKWIKSRKPEGKPKWPPENYMKEIGARCPDNWVFVKQDYVNGQLSDICQNVFDIPVADNTCYNYGGISDISKASGKMAAFPAIVDWDKYRNSDLVGSARCQWIRKCGPPSNIQGECGPAPTCGPAPDVPHPAGHAAWSGIDGYC